MSSGRTDEASSPYAVCNLQAMYSGEGVTPPRERMANAARMPSQSKTGLRTSVGRPLLSPSRCPIEQIPFPQRTL
jgi:hypothetical protein